MKNVIDMIDRRLTFVNNDIDALRQPMMGCQSDEDIDKRKYDLDKAYAIKQVLVDIKLAINSEMYHDQFRYKG